MWSSPITFERPIFLLLVPVGLFFVWLFTNGSRATVNAASRRQVVVIRTLTVVLIVLCIAGVTWHRRTDKLTTIYVVDVSDSVPIAEREATLRFIKSSLASKGSHDRVGIVVFGREPFVEFPPAESVDVTQVRADVPTDATDIQSALEAAAGLMPADSAKRIVLCTDGDENVESAASTMGTLKNAGIQVDVAPTMLAQSNSAEALVERLVTPAHASVNAPIGLRVVLSSTIAQPAKLTISRDGTPIARSSISLSQGKSAYYFDDRVKTAGVHTYTADLQPSSDTEPENNSASSDVDVHGAPSVLLIRDADEPIPSALPSALRAQGLSLTVSTPASAPANVSGFAGYDSIILSDVAAGDLTPSQITGLAAANHNFGVGLGMVGGLNSFGAGGYTGTPIETALPVTMTPKDKKRIPGADVVIVLDASGSMSAEENGLEKVEIAARAALNLLNALEPKDRVAVLAVTETATIVMPLVSPAQAAAYVPSIQAVVADGGGIDCRNGLEAAYQLLQTSNASIKHVIICPDTTDSEQQEGCVALATSEFESSRITTSVCGIGQWTDPDVPFQKALATAGHGQLFVANQAGNLPTFFQRDVMSVQQKLFMEGTFTIKQGSADEVVGQNANYPVQLGYNLVDPKPGATVPLTISDHGDPLVAYWRYGVGKSFAYTSDDDAHWSANWLIWPRFSSFWAHMVRWSLKGGADDSFQTLVTDIKGNGHIVVDAFNQNGYSTEGQFTAEIAGPSGSLVEEPLTESAPGRYEASFDASGVGSYLLQVHSGSTGGQQTSSITTPYSPEYADVSPNTELLGALASGTGGKFLSAPSEAFRTGPTLNLGELSLVNPLLLIACFLFLLDVAWRRFGWLLRQRTAEIAAQTVRVRAIAAASNIKRNTARQSADVFSRKPVMRLDNNDDPDFLKKRTAVRADMDDDDPFPYVTSLPQKLGRSDNKTNLKENK